MSSDNHRAALWLLSDMSLTVWALGIVKAIGLDYPASQLVFLRAIVGLAFIAPWALRQRHTFTHVDRLPLHFLRVVLSVTALACSYFAVARLPLALFTTINFTRPILLMLMAALVLSEFVPTRRWVAAAIGLVDVLIAIDPRGNVWSWGIPAVSLTVITGTLAILTTRKLKGTPTVVMMFLYSAGVMLLSAPLALLGWIPMAPEHVLPLLAIGAFAQSGQYCFLRAHWLGDASVLGLLGYLSLPLSGLVGYLFFTEIPTASTLIGATIILLALTQVGPR